MVVLSAGLLRDSDRRAFEAALDASRQANTAVSFVDVRGLIGQPMYGADQAQPPAAGDSGRSRRRRHSRRSLAASTSPSRPVARCCATPTTSQAPLAVSPTRARPTTCLGYQPDRTFDGRWRKLQVKVARSDVTVKARRGYFATADLPAAQVRTPKQEKEERKLRGKGKLPKRRLDPALAAGGERDAVPLRLKPHAFEAGQTARSVCSSRWRSTPRRSPSRAGERTRGAGGRDRGRREPRPDGHRHRLIRRSSFCVGEDTFAGGRVFSGGPGPPPRARRRCARSCATDAKRPRRHGGRARRHSRRMTAPDPPTPVLSDLVAKDGGTDRGSCRWRGGASAPT